MKFLLRDCLVMKRDSEPDPFDVDGRPQINGYAIVPIESWLDRKNVVTKELASKLFAMVGLYVPLAVRFKPDGFMQNSYLEIRRGEQIPDVVDGVVELDQYAIVPIENYIAPPTDD